MNLWIWWLETMLNLWRKPIRATEPVVKDYPNYRAYAAVNTGRGIPHRNSA